MPRDSVTDGAIDQREFIGGVRKKGQMTAVTISDEDLRKVFDEIDTDNNGTVNVHELGEFVWGEGAWRDALQEQSQERRGRRRRRRRRPPPPAIAQDLD